jgi:hypothetical protein
MSLNVEELIGRNIDGHELLLAFKHAHPDRCADAQRQLDALRRQQRKLLERHFDGYLNENDVQLYLGNLSAFQAYLGNGDSMSHAPGMSEGADLRTPS